MKEFVGEISETKDLIITDKKILKVKTARIIFTGGFLGAGKTTLLWEAAQRLMKQGLNVGLITNDQAPELVDSVLLSKHGLKVSEVSGSCFCCNFNGLTAAIQQLRTEAATDIIIAEPDSLIVCFNPSVVGEITRQDLPEVFQTAAFYYPVA
jgi:Ni2+-binding GTPase involved in maturation of urease and hydrogenase